MRAAVAYLALAVLGELRWGALLVGVPAARLLAPVAIGGGLAGALVALRGHRTLAAVGLSALTLLSALPVAGVPVRWLLELRIALVVRLLVHGIDAIPTALVPVLGAETALRVAILLGAAWLTILGGLLIGLAGARRRPEGLRATAMVPLLVLVAVPDTLLSPRAPYLEGAVVFALVAACVWAGRLARVRALTLLAVAGAGAVLLAPALRAAHPWIDVRHLAGALGGGSSERFDFTQSFGPLKWPRTGRVVLEVRARRPEYWKVVDLDTFDGRGFAPATASRQRLPAPDPQAQARGTQTITVDIRALQSADVIAAGTAEVVWRIPGTVEPALSPGGFTVDPPLAPGESYDTVTYTPQPVVGALQRVRVVPQIPELAPYLSMYLPSADATEVIQFPAFHTGSTSVLAGTPYARVYALARGLAQRAPTPYALVRSVLALLGRGFVYDERPAASPDPLVSFLLSTHRGYCQQFAGAMALLLRMGGVPARVVGGFTTGTLDPASGRWVVRDTDAHDWVEVWFPHSGWVTFDPTPAVDPARAASVRPPSITSADAPHGHLPSRAAGLRHRDLTGGAGGLVARRLPSAARRGHGGTAAAWLALVAVTACLAALGGALTLRHRRRAASRDYASALLVELERALARCGRPVGGGVTLAALERRFAGREGAARYVRALRQARFAGAEAAPRPEDRRALRAALGEGLGLAGRLRAWWALPPRGRVPPGLH